jgi:hypothetical protein
MINSNQKIDLLFWTALTVAVLLLILFFGLRPKGIRFENPVRLIPGEGVIVFRKNGIAFVDDVSSARVLHPGGELTIEMAVRAGDVGERGFNCLLMIHDGNDRQQLIVGQWGSAVIVMNGDDYDHTRRLPRLSAKDALSTEKVRLLTITASAKGTRLYVDGVLAGVDKDWQLTVPNQGKPVRLILGNSLKGKNSWIGEFYGLAIYTRALSGGMVKRHRDQWDQGVGFSIDEKEDLLLSYTFKAKIGNWVQDQSGANQPLIIPARPIVLAKTFLSPPWHRFKLNRSFLFDTVLNVVGFIPLGVVLYGWLRQTGLFTIRHNAWATVMLCSVLSFCIEILQAWIPTRSSSLMDWFMNTMGAWLGVWLVARASHSKWALTFIRPEPPSA